MSTFQRLKLVGAALAVAGVITCTQVFGDASRNTGPMQPAASNLKIAEGLAATKFAQPFVCYQARSGDTFFGAQIQPKLASLDAQPRDIVVLIDNSASQAGTSYTLARKMSKTLSETLRTDDRIDIWTLNIPAATRSLTKGFQPPKSDMVAEALNKLENSEYSSGVCDLKGGLQKVLKQFDVREGRQPIVLLLGDGESAYDPITDSQRFQIAQEMVNQKIAFFAVPLGVQLNPTNLHGFASSTGGAMIRLLPKESTEELSKRMLDTMSAPILYPTRFELTKGAIEAYPTRLPPLRGDSPTLMIGRLKDSDAFAVTIEGTVAGRATSVEVRHQVSKPENDNFFLKRLLEQWSQAGSKAAPALIRADRALAYAFQQTLLTQEEYITQAHWALAEDKFDVAEKLFGLAEKVNPYDGEAAKGLAVVKKLRDGTLTAKHLHAEIAAAKAKADKMDVPFQRERADRVDLAHLLVKSEDQQPPAGAGAGAPAAQPADNLLKEAQQQQRLAEQQVADSVDRTIKNAKVELSRNPDLAYELLKRQLEAVQNNVAIGEKLRTRLGAQLQGQMTDVEMRGREIKLRLEQDERQRILAAKEDEKRVQRDTLQQIGRERQRAFVSLMNKARYDEAYKEANLFREELINKGEPVGIGVTAAYGISLNAMNLKELNELKRIREERFLLTMMQVEKSHIPYPDEPPVHFPPAATWKELTKLRNKYYDYYSLGFRKSPNFSKVIRRLNESYGTGVDKEVELPLDKWFDQFNSKLEATGFYMLPNMKVLKSNDPDLSDLATKASKIPPMPGATLGTVMTMVLANHDLTYFVNEDHIEVTTKKVARKDFNHALRVYEVADLVIPIPQAINAAGVGQTLAVLGGAFSFGSTGSPFNAFGNGGAIGGIGGFQIGGVGGIGGIGGIGGLGIGGGIGGLGIGGGIGGLGIGGIGGGLGMGGGGLGMGANGAPNFGGGAGGGFLGFGGGQAGQLGNLGGQFGFQGRTFENYLVQLIMDTVARGHWARVPANLQIDQMGGGGMMEEENTSLIPADEKFSLGFYPPALAMVVSAPSRYRPTVKYPREGSGGAGGGGNAMAPMPRRGDALALRDDELKPKKLDPAALAKANEEWAKSKPRKEVTGKDWEKGLAANGDLPPEELANRARLLTATVSFLGAVGEWGHAAELLKANLRLGVTNGAWVFEALALALEQCHGSAEELERARLSAIDLNPKDPNSYLAAAKAMNESKQPERAVAFCRRAAELSPNMADPYANALVYLEKTKSVDSDSVHWAVSNLLRRDWMVDRELYHDQARDALQQAKAKLLTENRKAEADKIQNSVTEQQHRDLLIELIWQDAADLDLVVVEPINTTCSATQRQTPAGSLLVCDDIKERKETYTVSEAFSGTYVVKVNRVWGRPLGGKAMIKVTKHAGTPDQLVEYHTISVDKTNEEVRVTLAGGRRTQLATVALPIMQRNHPYNNAKGEGLAKGIEKLRLLADPTYRNDMTVRAGGSGASGSRSATVFDLANTPKGTTQFSYETRVEGEAIGVDLTAKVEVTSSGEARFKIVPAFDTANTLNDVPKVTNPLIPGGK